MVSPLSASRCTWWLGAMGLLIIRDVMSGGVCGVTNLLSSHSSHCQSVLAVSPSLPPPLPPLCLLHPAIKSIQSATGPTTWRECQAARPQISSTSSSCSGTNVMSWEVSQERPGGGSWVGDKLGERFQQVIPLVSLSSDVVTVWLCLVCLLVVSVPSRPEGGAASLSLAQSCPAPPVTLQSWSVLHSPHRPRPQPSPTLSSNTVSSEEWALQIFYLFICFKVSAVTSPAGERFKEQSVNICCEKRIKKTFYHRLIKKNIRPRELFFLWSNIWHLVWPTISSHFHPILAKDLHVMFSESPGQGGRTDTWLLDFTCPVLLQRVSEREREREREGGNWYVRY